MMKIAIGILLLCLVVGCTTTRKPLPQPVSIINPAEGNAAIYIFRPDLDQVRKSNTPNLFVDGVFVAQLPYASYTRVELPVGMHALKLAPKGNQSQAWNAEAAFELTKDEVYFVAIWNANQPRRLEASVPLVLPGLLVLLPIYGPGGGSKIGAAFEAVDSVTGEFSLSGLRYIPENRVLK